MDKLALIVGKSVSKILKLFNKSGGSFPGKKAHDISKTLLKRFKFPKMTVLVTGTNGKTSTANMIAKIIRSVGIDVDNNSKGDNIINGILSLCIKNSDYNYNIKKEALVIEIDELTLANNLKNIKASHIVINNFFRDQLDRAGEMENIITKIGTALKNYTGTLILNIDDPNVYRLKYYAKKAKIITYGLDKIDTPADEIVEAKEGKFCPNCDSEIYYDYYQYSHIGKYYCKKCDFKRTEPDYEGKNVDFLNNSIEIGENKYKINIMLPYHLYNCMAAYSLCGCIGIDNKYFADVVKNFNLELGRMENIKGSLLNLVKNPTGANEIIRYIRLNKNKKVLLFLLNDNVADGHDVSWIWDVEIKDINNLEKIICTGERAYDMAVRFKYAGYKNIEVIPNLSYAVKTLYNSEHDKYAISNYTGLFGLRKEMLNVSENIMDVQ